jgi:hypothetical protein
MDLTMMEIVDDRYEKMEGSCSTGLTPQWAVVPVEEEEEEEEEEVTVSYLAVRYIYSVRAFTNILDVIRRTVVS